MSESSPLVFMVALVLFHFLKTFLYWVGALPNEGLLPYLETILKEAVGYVILCSSSYRTYDFFFLSPSSSLENMCQ